MKTLNKKTRVLVLGSGEFIKDLLQQVRRNANSTYDLIGLVTDTKHSSNYAYGCPILGDVDRLCAIIAEHNPQSIIVGPPYNRTSPSDQSLLEARCGRNVRVEHAEEVYERLTGKLPIEALEPREVIFSEMFKPKTGSLLCSRMLSWCVAVLGLTLLAPVMLLLAAAIKLDTPGPALFVQNRCGAGGRPFKLYKFRTMRMAGAGASQWEGDNKHRITRVGRWLRRFRLDELPQFINVLNGDMNLVGPRPHPASNYALLMLVARNTPESGAQIPFYSLRCNVRPGITGWAQVKYCYANNINEEIEKLRFDLYYLKHYSFWLDLRIIAETAWVVVAGHRTSAEPAASTAPSSSQPRLATSE